MAETRARGAKRVRPDRQTLPETPYGRAFSHSYRVHCIADRRMRPSVSSGPRGVRGRRIAYLVMLVLIAKHLLADSYGPWDRLLEIGVFLFIAYEVIAGTVRHRRTTRRQGELKQIVTSLSQFMNTGRKLQRSVPDTAKEESGVLQSWMMNTKQIGRAHV